MLAKMLVGVVIIALSSIALTTNDASVAFARQQEKQTGSTSSERYSCPMHPEVVSSKPDKCSKCGMNLRLEKAAAPDTSVKSGADGNAPLNFPQIPDTPVYDQHGKQLKFYSDLVKHKVVAINFVFTTCTTICPPLTATFRRVQQELEAASMKDVQLISISVDPTVDTPERLADFAAKFKAGPGWTFVTGEKDQINALLRALSMAVSNKNDHTPVVLVGNDLSGHWARTYGLSRPSTIVKVITDAAKSASSPKPRGGGSQ